MNEHIKNLAEQAGFNLSNDPIDGHMMEYEVELLARILLIECVKIAVFRGDKETGKAIMDRFELGLTPSMLEPHQRRQKN
jgi:hypothetical protein